MKKLERALYMEILCSEFGIKKMPLLRVKKSAKIGKQICFAYYEFWLDRITMSKKMNPTSIEFFATLAHEFVHVWQDHNSKKINHKKSYRKWCAIFQIDYNLDLDGTN